MHVSRLPSGRWRAIVQHNGQRASITRPTRSEAQQAAAELLLTLGATPNRATATVNELVAGHLAETVYDWSPTTHADAHFTHIPFIDACHDATGGATLLQPPAILEGVNTAGTSRKGQT